MTIEPRRGLGPLGRRLLAAFVLVALSSVAVLTIAALIGTARGLAAGEAADRGAAAAAASSAAADAYSRAGGWDSADLSSADTIAAAGGARLAVRDANGTVVRAPSGSGMGNGMGGMGGVAGSGVVVAPVVVDGATVGTVRLAFGSASAGSAQQVAWTWILIAAVAALVTAIVVSWYVTRRISRPLVRLSGTARAFAAGDRSARADAEDVAAPGELGELARAFDATAIDVERSEIARRHMAADLAHELRTPLAALQAGLEELRDGYVVPDHERLEALHDQSLRIARVVDDLAQLSAAETASLSLRRSKVDLGSLVADAISAGRPAMTAAGLTIEAQLPREVIVDGDTDRLHQVVGNLLGNTARHCRRGDTVTVSVTRQDPFAVLVVADTGPGIDAVDLASVFDRLWRGRADVDAAGSGIGLAVVRELVNAHGGTVTASSNGRSGSEFTVRLPLAAASARRD